MDANSLLGWVLGQQQAGVAHICNDPLARLGQRKIGVGATGGAQPALPRDQRDQRQIVRAPPRHIGGIAEGAAHHGAAAFVGIDGWIGQDRHRAPDQRDNCGLAE